MPISWSSRASCASILSTTSLSRPSSIGQRLPDPRPVIIDIHGGPEGQSRPSFNPIHQQMVNELGAAVIVPNVRGSTGYGKNYRPARQRGRSARTRSRTSARCSTGSKTQPDLDATRIVVYGQSYGGYMVLRLHDALFRPAGRRRRRYGISNWVSFLNNTEAYRRDQRRAEYGDERDPAMKAVFDQISPLNNVAKITKPMLIMQGLNDPRVPSGRIAPDRRCVAGEGNCGRLCPVQGRGPRLHEEAEQRCPPRGGDGVPAEPAQALRPAHGHENGERLPARHFCFRP